jgi:hypothetical protein
MRDRRPDLPAVRLPPHFVDPRHAEGLDKAAAPEGSEAQCTSIALALEPAELEAAAAYFRADMPGDVVAALAPVQAGTAEDSSKPAGPRQFRAEARKHALAGIGHLATILGEHDAAACHQRVGNRHAERPGDVIVAGAGEAQRLVARQRGAWRGGSSMAATALMLSSMAATSGDAMR